MLDGGKVHRRALAAQHAVALALVLVVAHKAAHRGEGVVFKQHPARLVEVAVQHQADHLRDGRMDGAALLALRHFAVEAALRLVQHVIGHV